jgi:hypothetical protein
VSVFVVDSFTDSSDVGLAAHTPELGGPWVDHPHINYSGNAFLVDSASDRLYGIATDALYAAWTPGSADYYAQAEFCHISTISQNVAVCVRMDTTADTMYIARLNSGTIWELRKIIATVATTIGSTTNQLTSVGTSKIGRLVAQGDQVSFYIQGVLEIGPITDGSITAAGKAGVRNAGAASPSAGFHLDNFEAGTIDTSPSSDPSFQVLTNRPAMFRPAIPR